MSGPKAGLGKSPSASHWRHAYTACRLRFSFINLRRPDATSNGGSDAELLNRGRAPVLAQVFSEKFQVYSAKKFPGVCESTALSKCFAVQGVKIPIRKDGQDGKGSKGRGSDDEDDN